MRKTYPILLIAVVIILSLIAYPRLPDQVPIHWDAHGNVNGYGSRLMATVFAPVIMLVLWLIMRGLPYVDPLRDNYAKMRGAYDLVIAAALTIVAVAHLMVLAPAFGWQADLGRLMPALVGATLIIVGNVLPQARPNWFFGIRTPWTLSNDRVWQRTHRVGGYMFVAAGVIGIVGTLASRQYGFMALFIAASAAALGAVAFSYITWRQEQDNGGTT